MPAVSIVVNTSYFQELRIVEQDPVHSCTTRIYITVPIVYKETYQNDKIKMFICPCTLITSPFNCVWVAEEKKDVTY